MMVKRKGTYYYDQCVGPTRIKCSLGTADQRIAKDLFRRLDRAIHEGPESKEWRSLGQLLSPKSVRALAEKGFGPRLTSNRQAELAYVASLDQKVRLGVLASSTSRSYQSRVAHFMDWLNPVWLSDLTSHALGDYLLVRSEELGASKTNGRGVLNDVAALKNFFRFLTEEKRLSPVHFPDLSRPLGEAGGAEPFTDDELMRMETLASDVGLLVFHLLRWTGLRRSDAVSLTWGNIDWGTRTLTVRAKKNDKTVSIPLHPTLAKTLELWYNKPVPSNSDDPVLPDMSDDKLYRIVRKLGIEAGVKDARPHRFRDTLCVTLLRRGSTVYECARILGDTVASVDKFYARWVPELQDKVRVVFEKDAA